MFRKLSFKSKLLILCLLLSSVAAAVGGFNYYTYSFVVSQYNDVVSKNLPSIRNSDRMYLSFRKLRINLRSLGLPGLSKEMADDFIGKVHDAINEYEEANKEYLALEFLPGEKETYDKVHKVWEEFKVLGAKALALHKSGKPEDHAALMNIFLVDCPRLAALYTSAIEDLVTFQQKSASGRTAGAQDATARANTLSMLIVLCGILGGLGVGFMFSLSMSKSLQQVSNGLTEGALIVDKVAQQIADASESLSASTTQQAAALQETTAAIEETSAMIQKNAENAKISTDVSEQSQQTASKGQQAVTEMLHSIEEISASNNEIMQQIEESNREISEIVKVIAEIGNKTKVINDIVFQTKLLSFNASVEAARAGEHGKGFAVVAEEVGNLAQMSGNSAKEISEMLEGSIKKVEMIVQNTQSRVGGLVQSGKEKVSAGTATAKRCSEILEEIVSNVTRVGSLVSEISVASQEQSKGVSEINKAMSELDSVAQQNSSASQQTSTSAEDLKVQVAGVRDMVLQLNEVLLGQGNGNSSHHGASATSHQSQKVVDFKSAKAKSNAKSKKFSGPRDLVPMKKASGLDVPGADDSGFSES